MREPEAIVSTYIDPTERDTLARCLSAHLAVRPRSHIDAVRHDAATVASAVVVSSAAAPRPDPATLRAVATVPGVLSVAYLSAATKDRAAAAYAFGAAGFSVMIDGARSDACHELRAVLAPNRLTDPFRRAALAQLLAGVETTGRFRAFLAASFTTNNVRDRLAPAIGTHPSSLNSRFYRSGLPSPKAYADYGRALWALHLHDVGLVSGRAIADRLDASSAQSLGRFVKRITGMTMQRFLAAHTAESFIPIYRGRLILPHAATLATFDPCTPVRDWKRRAS